MKKTLIGGAILLVLSLGVGAVVFAAEEDGKINFGQMLPHMQKMHSDMTTEQLNDMYNSCHGTGGAEKSRNFQSMQGMMGN